MKKFLLITLFVFIFLFLMGVASATDRDNMTDDSLISVEGGDADGMKMEQTENDESNLNDLDNPEYVLPDGGLDTSEVNVNDSTAVEGDDVTVKFNITDSEGSLICGDVNVTVSGENMTVSKIIIINNASDQYMVSDLVGFIKANDKSNLLDIYNLISSSVNSTNSNVLGLISGFGNIYNGLGLNVSAFITSILDITNSSDVNVTRLIDGLDKIERSINISMLMNAFNELINLSNIDIKNFSMIFNAVIGGFDFNVDDILNQFRKGISFYWELMSSGITDLNNEFGFFETNNIIELLDYFGLSYSLVHLLKAMNLFSNEIVVYSDLVDLFKDILNYNSLTPVEFMERTINQNKINFNSIVSKLVNSDFNRINVKNALVQIINAIKLDYSILKSSVKNTETSSFNSSKVIDELAGISGSFNSSKIIRSIYNVIMAFTSNVSGFVDGSNDIAASFKFHIPDSVDAFKSLKNSFNLNTSLIMNGRDMAVVAMGINVSAAICQIISKYGYFVTFHSSFAPGYYNVSVKYLSNDRYDSAVNDTAKLTVVNKDTSIAVYALSDRSNLSVECHISSNTSGIAVLEFSNYFAVVPLINGNLIYETNFAPMDYDVKVRYFENGHFYKNNTSVSFTVKIPTKIAASDVKTTYGTSKNLAITLTDADGNPLENKEIIVKLKEKQYKSITNAKGQVSIALPKTLAPNIYTASISFANDDYYLQTSGTVKVVVSKAKPKIIAKAKTIKVKAKSKKYTIVLKNDKGNVIKNAKLTIKVKGKIYKATTNSKGKATFKLSKLTKKGKFTATVKYKGNKYYKNVSKKVKITIK